ncbi:hypothetical protein [Arsukibacterium ikkense]|uniref:hypothetical protein n=1 Tax=Arsukibacterium ikkense TaxID=336831 RepID=UPI00128CA77D|nr:hypothetical protein [Arsukibacterium ikkense]
MKTLFSCSVILCMAFASQADPTRPASGFQASYASSSSVTSGPETLRLQLIQDTNAGKTAIINGRLLQLGEQYQGYTLFEISAATVVLKRGDEQRILQLHNKTIKNYDK